MPSIISAAPPVRKPSSSKPPFPQRVAHDYNPLTGIVFISLDDDTAGYFCDVAHEDGSPIGVALTKIVSREVHSLAVDGYGVVCSCKGFTHYSRCRHAVAVARLIEDNQF